MFVVFGFGEVSQATGLPLAGRVKFRSTIPRVSQVNMFLVY